MNKTNSHNTEFESGIQDEAFKLGWNACKAKMNKILNDQTSWEYVDNENEILTKAARDKLDNL